MQYNTLSLTNTDFLCIPPPSVAGTLRPTPRRHHQSAQQYGTRGLLAETHTTNKSILKCSCESKTQRMNTAIHKV